MIDRKIFNTSIMYNAFFVFGEKALNNIWIRVRCCGFIMISVLTITTSAECLSNSDILFSSKEIDGGGLILVTIKTGEQEKPQMIWMKKKVPLLYSHTPAMWLGFIGADLKQKAGLYPCIVRITFSGFKKRYDIGVKRKYYGVRKLKLPRGKVILDASSLERVKYEAATINALWAADNTSPKWKGHFIMPLNGDIVETFGKKSIINNLQRSPHSGVDLKGNKGDPVRAMNHGKVILSADHFFSGRSLYLDHGGGIISMYFHLDEILVKKGAIVKKGDVIGLVGATGRVTGPHLHWGVRINGARIDPMALIELSGDLEE
ncbi:MAG: M23 family metallopeptidase [Syntrophaceae bacterium]|nr:M23 family metallopeptidase [Syntrophaceae bacterium]